MNRALKSVLLTAATAALAIAQYTSPPAETSVTIDGKAISIKYCAPSMHGRKIFGAPDALQKPGTIWRAGANQATALHTDADLEIHGITIPKGNYTLFVALDQGKWELIVNKETGQWGIKRDGSANLDEAKNAARVPMEMSKPPAAIETYKMTLSSAGGKQGKLQLEWENVIASVPFTVR